ncbi:MAG: DUF4249 family protein [Bacteroidia bacterium]|nr:DUF4249 family protein [Bacteroidia bacterium]
MKKAGLIVLISSTLFLSCKNDLEVIAPYQEQIVSYCLLDPFDSVHYVKVTKSFLGNMDAYQMAAYFDSVNFRPGEITVTIEKMQGENVLQSIPLFIDSTLPRDSGVFSFPKQYLYKTNTAISGDGSEYRLKVRKNEDGKEVRSRAKTVEPITVVSPLPNQSLNLWGSFPYKSKFRSARNGKLFALTVRIHFKEKFVFDTTQVSTRYIDLRFSNHTASNLEGGEEFSEILDRETFYKTIGNHPDIADNPNIVRQFLYLEFIFSAAAIDFSNYLEVVSAANATFGEKPVYSNIEGGYGLFSTRRTQRMPNIGLNAQSLDSLKYGVYTSTKNFR